MRKFLAPILAGLSASALSVAGQVEMPGSPAGINAVLSKLFGDIKAFSAKSEVQVLSQDQKRKISTPMDFAMLGDKIRVGVDMSQMKNEDISAAAAANMKQFGMDQVVSIIRPDKKVSYIIFPRLEAYVNLPLPKEDVETYGKTPKLERTALGKETLDGHPCVKNKVIITDDNGRRHETTVWNATDLKDFPVQIMTKEKDDTVILRYRQVQMDKPDAKQFEPPGGFKEYSDMQSLLQGAMTKAINGGSAPAK